MSGNADGAPVKVFLDILTAFKAVFLCVFFYDLLGIIKRLFVAQ